MKTHKKTAHTISVLKFLTLIIPLTLSIQVNANICEQIFSKHKQSIKHVVELEDFGEPKRATDVTALLNKTVHFETRDYETITGLVVSTPLNQRGNYDIILKDGKATHIDAENIQKMTAEVDANTLSPKHFKNKYKHSQEIVFNPPFYPPQKSQEQLAVAIENKKRVALLVNDPHNFLISEEIVGVISNGLPHSPQFLIQVENSFLSERSILFTDIQSVRILEE